ncbi:hypothetical protein IAT38_007517 [Cryptococcus sp. DSM 104549]
MSVANVSAGELQAWAMMGADGHGPVWFSTVGVVLQAMITAAIIDKTSSYYDYFTKRDKWFVRWAVGMGTLVTFVSLVLSIAQIYKLIFGLQQGPGSAIRFVIIVDFLLLALGALINTFGGSYYAYRTYKMAGDKVWLVIPFGLGLAAQLIFSLYDLASATHFPKAGPDMPALIPVFMERQVVLFRSWGAITLSVDGSMCVLMTFLLIKSRDGIFYQETRLFRRMVSLIYETMLPPVIVLLIMVITAEAGHSPLTDARRILSVVLPALQWHSALHTLVGRHIVRTILDNKLASEGVQVLSKDNGVGSGSGNGGYSTFSNPDEKARSRTVKFGKNRNSKGDIPGIRVQTTTQTTVSEPDALHAAMHKPSVNRNWVEDSPLSEGEEDGHNVNVRWSVVSSGSQRDVRESRAGVV